MKPVKGLSKDYKLLEQPAQTYPFGKNGIWNGNTMAIQNEKGFRISSANIPGTINGVVETDSNPIIFSTDDVNSFIGFYNEATDQYDSRIDDTTLPYKLNFKKTYFIKGEARRNYKNHIEVAWLDKLNPVRFADLDEPPTDLSNYLIFPEYKAPTINLEIVNGGTLGMGSYFVGAKYTNADGTETRFSTLTPPIFATAPNFGALPGTSTGKSLKITITGTDSRYTHIQVVIVKRVKGVTTAVQLPAVPVTDPLTVLFTGSEGDDITLEETLIPAAFYNNAGAITQLNDILYLADIKESQILNLQKYASLARIRWQSKYVDTLENNDDVKSGKIRTFKHGEAYAGYLVYALTNGQFTDAFHIPGFTPDANALMLDPAATAQGFTAYKYQTNTLGINFDIPNKTGNTGYWINRSEVYPNRPEFDSSAIGGEDLRGKPVRHHKMPTLQQTGSLLYSSVTNYGSKGLDALGLIVENIVIPPELIGTVIGYELYYAKRDYASSTIASQAMLTYGAYSGRTGNDVYFTGGNWDASVNRSDFSHSDGSRAFRLVGDVWKVNHPDLMVNRPAVIPTFMASNFKIQANIGTNNLIKQSVDEVNFITDFYTNGNILDRSYSIKGVKDSGYLINNGSRGNIKNIKSEDGFVGRYNVNSFPLTKDEVIKAARQTEGSFNVPAYEQSFNIDLVTVKDDIYRTFTNQDLVRTGIINDISSAGNNFAYTGDCFLVLHAYWAYGLSNSLDRFPTQPGRQDGINSSDEDTYVDEFYYGTSGTKAVRRYATESIMNMWQRYIDPAVPESRFWTAISADTMNGMDRNKDNNLIAISKDSNSIGDLLNGIKAFDFDAANIEDSPYKIIRSTKQTQEAKFNSWKNYNALDYFETEKNMGRIINLQGMNDRLIIHHRNALYWTEDKTTLQGDILAVTLGTGDIFRLPPRQGKVSKLGYGGTQHQLACTLTDFGYVFPDAETGVWFVLNDQGLMEMNMDMYNFFREYVNIPEINPFIGNGICVGYDREFKRILITVKNQQLSSGSESTNPNYVPNYQPTAEFFAKLTPGVSIVFKDGRYQLYKGQNTSIYQCTIYPLPELGNYTWNVNELEVVGFVVGQISATGDGSLSYILLSGNDDNAFSLDPITGNLTVGNSAALNTSIRSEFNMVAKVMDTHGGSDTGNIRVIITPVAKPPVTQDYIVSIDENIPADTSIVAVAATDPKGLALTWSIVSQSVPGAVAINSATGQLSVADATAFNYEVNPQIDVVVQVTNTVPLSAISNVTIFLNDLNEPPIAYDKTVTILTTATGVVMVYNKPTDPDQSGQTITEEVVSESTPGAFLVNTTTREVSVAPGAVLSPLLSPYIIHMLARDNGTPSLTTPFTLTINVNYEPTPVTINWSINRQPVPYVDGNILVYKGGIEIERRDFNGSGVLTGPYLTGDTLEIQAFHFAFSNRWPDDASLTFIVKNAVGTIIHTYTGGTVMDALVDDYILTLVDNTYSLEVTTFSADASLATLGYDVINNNIGIADEVVYMQVIDDTTGLSMLDLIPAPSFGTHREGNYNVKNDANTQRVTIRNTSGIDIGIRLKTLGAYDRTFNMVAGQILTKPGLDKTKVTLTVQGTSGPIIPPDPPVNTSPIIAQYGTRIEGSPATIGNTYRDEAAARSLKGTSAPSRSLWFSGTLSNDTILYRDSAMTQIAFCYSYYIPATDMIFIINGSGCSGTVGNNGSAPGAVRNLQAY